MKGVHLVGAVEVVIFSIWATSTHTGIRAPANAHEDCTQSRM